MNTTANDPAPTEGVHSALRAPTLGRGAELEAGANPLLWRIAAWKRCRRCSISALTWKYAAGGGGATALACALAAWAPGFFALPDYSFEIGLLLALHAVWLGWRARGLLAEWRASGMLDQLLLTRFRPREILGAICQGTARPVGASFAAAYLVLTPFEIVHQAHWGLRLPSLVWLGVFPFAVLGLFVAPWLGMAAALDDRARSAVIAGAVAVLLSGAVAAAWISPAGGLLAEMAAVFALAATGVAAAARTAALLEAQREG